MGTSRFSGAGGFGAVVAVCWVVLSAATSSVRDFLSRLSSITLRRSWSESCLAFSLSRLCFL